MPNNQVVTSGGIIFDAEQVGTKFREGVTLTTCTSGGWKPYYTILTASNNAAVVKSGGGQVYAVWGGNYTVAPNVSTFFVKLYDKASNPNPATDTPKMVFPFEPNAPNFFPLGAGLDAFTTGIAILVVLGLGNTDNTPIVNANDGLVCMGFF